MPSTSTLIELTRRYCEPHRQYHGIHHIAAILAAAKDLDLSDAQLLAIWFHDAIYDPRSTTNEQDSAQLAQQLLTGDGVDAATIALVQRIVLDTIHHRPSCSESELVMDLDLSSLALPRRHYEANTVRIRAEYAHVPDEQFAVGRKQFVEGILIRPRIYTTAWGAQHEQPARTNLERDLQEAGVVRPTS